MESYTSCHCIFEWIFVGFKIFQTMTIWLQNIPFMAYCVRQATALDRIVEKCRAFKSNRSIFEQ